MKFVKRISLFFIYPTVLFGGGFYAGVESMHFFYPGTVYVREAEETQPYTEDVAQDIPVQRRTIHQMDVKNVSAVGETLSVDTEYVLKETDIVNQSVVETVCRLPSEYVGLDREKFLTAMEEYEIHPPLAEIERGFVGLDVLSFSRERVVVQMNYEYVQPSTSFYLAVHNNEVVVYLEDRETIYINTGIQLEELPEDVQLEIIQMLWIEDEESLYYFLENYSS